MTTTDTTLEPAIIRPGEGTRLVTRDGSVQFKLGSEQTGGTMVLGLAVTQPGGGPPLHVHSREDEVFIIQEGRLHVFANGAWTEARPGTVIFLPRGEPHTYRNMGEVACKHWVLATPGGFDHFYTQWSTLVASTGAPDANRMAELCDESGIEILGPAPGA